METGPNGNLWLENSANDYQGVTIVSNCNLVVDGNKTSGNLNYIGNLSRIAGKGAVFGDTFIDTNSTIYGGDPGLSPGILTFPGTTNTLTMNWTGTNVFDLSPSVNFDGTSSGVDINGNLVMNGTNTFMPIVDRYVNSGKTYTLIRYAGTLSGTGATTNYMAVIQPPGYQFLITNHVNPGGGGLIQLYVVSAISSVIPIA